RRPAPPGDPGILHRDPQVMVRVFYNLKDEVTRQPSRSARRVRVPQEFVAVVPDQAVLGPQPYEALRVLEGHVDRALRQAIGRGEMLEEEGGRVGRGGGNRLKRQNQRCGDEGSPRASPPSRSHSHTMPQVPETFVDPGSAANRGAAAP